MTIFIYGLGIFTGSFLLFLVQPLAGKILLPYLGGAPAVWTACMLFFQVALLAGYLYAEKSIKYLGCEKQSVGHLLLMILGMVFLPLNIGFTSLQSATATPFTWIFARLTASIGFLFFMIAANAPLLQRWYSRTGRHDSHDPYFLYSASNVGSLLALLSYPLFFEPSFSVSVQKLIWSGLYLLQTVFVLLCALSFWGKIPAKSQQLEESFYQNSKLPFITIVKWVMYGFIPCSGMLAVTTHIATDIASGPLLWIFPLSIYLISFILVFARSERFRQINWDNYLLPMSVLISVMYFFALNERTWFSIPLHFLFLFFLCMSFHGRLANERPAVCFLNSFYVWMALGGILGGIFNSLLAPNIFKTQLEYILTIMAGFVLAAFSRSEQEGEISKTREFGTLTVFVLILLTFAWFDNIDHEKVFGTLGLLALLASFTAIRFALRFKKIAAVFFVLCCLMMLNYKHNRSNVVMVDRSFFGVHKITSLKTDGIVVDPDLKIEGIKDVFYCLVHGNTVHGIERKVDVRAVMPLSYYTKEGPVGNIFRAALIKRWARKIGIVGLGCGTIAWYGRPWQQMDFYEIDPLIIKIASNPDYFTYLHNSRARCRIIEGDARINLQQTPDNYYDMLVLDAYSSDSVPIHLLTVEAVELYLQKLKPDGLLVLHLSNRYFKLGLVAARIFAKLDIAGMARLDDPKNYSIKYDWYDESQLSRSYWAVASKDLQKLRLIRSLGTWDDLVNNEAYSPWTDDYANLLQVYNWK